MITSGSKFLQQGKFRRACGPCGTSFFPKPILLKPQNHIRLTAFSHNFLRNQKIKLTLRPEFVISYRHGFTFER